MKKIRAGRCLASSLSRRNPKGVRLALISTAILALSACASTPTPTKVNVLVPTPCLTRDQLPASPKASADADLAKLPEGDFVLQLASDRLEYRRHSNEAQAVLEACVK